MGIFNKKTKSLQVQINEINTDITNLSGGVTATAIHSVGIVWTNLGDN